MMTPLSWSLLLGGAAAAANVLGEPGKGYKIAIETLNEGRIGIGAQMLGLAQGAWNAAAKYALERKQFGKPIAEFQMIAAMLADMDAGTEAARQLLYKACVEIESGAADAARWSAMCKLVAGDTAMRVTTDAVQLFGGRGVRQGEIVERLYREIRALRIYEGASEIQELIIGRDLLKQARGKA